MSAGGGLFCRWVCIGDVLCVVNARCTVGGDIMKVTRNLVYNTNKILKTIYNAVCTSLCSVLQCVSDGLQGVVYCSVCQMDCKVYCTVRSINYKVDRTTSIL